MSTSAVADDADAAARVAARVVVAEVASLRIDIESVASGHVENGMMYSLSVSHLSTARGGGGGSGESCLFFFVFFFGFMPSFNPI